MSWDKVPVDLSDLRVFSAEADAQKGRILTYRQAVREALSLAL